MAVKPPSGGKTPKTMNVILLKPVEKLGRAGDVKDVSAGYFRNFMLPRGLAELATAAGLKRAELMRAKSVKQQARDREMFSALLKALGNEHIVLLRKATDEGHLFGSVTEEDIKNTLADKGYKIDQKHIHIETHIKELGTYPIVLKFEETIMGTISIAVEREA